MTDEEILALGTQADLCDEYGTINWEYGFKDEIIAFAKLVAEKERKDFAVHAVDIARRAIRLEREACAKIADKKHRELQELEETHYKYSPAPFNPRQFGIDMELANHSKYLAMEIRARGEQ